MFGRKLFVWGMGQGGRHWNEWLSEKGSAYIEIQAGLAHTQLEHIPMKAHETWDWLEAYTGIDGAPEEFHQGYDAAVGKVDELLEKKLGDPERMYFPPDESVISSERVAVGSDFGSLEEAVRGERISKTLIFPRVDSDETAAWRKLLENGTFPCQDAKSAPASYMTGEFWRDRLTGLTDWYSLLELGVTEYALSAYQKGSVSSALEYFRKSYEATPNAWATRNIAMIYKNEYNEPCKASGYILEAFRLAPDCLPLCIETAAILTNFGRDEKWLEIFETLSQKSKGNGRLRLYKAIALIHLDRLDEAAEILRPDFEIPDIKEGELSVSQLWYELYGRIWARDHKVRYNAGDPELKKAIEADYPLPYELDFRMH